MLEIVFIRNDIRKGRLNMKINGIRFVQLGVWFICTGMLSFSDGLTERSEGATEDFSYDNSYRVLSVLDGDTITIEYYEQSETVELIGVDTPETAHPTKPSEFFAREAAEFTRNLLIGESVYLRFWNEARDEDNRLLAYVFRAPDGLFVNLELLRQGYGQAYKIPHEHAEWFRQWEDWARHCGKGLWGGTASDLVLEDEPVNTWPRTVSEAVETILGEMKPTDKRLVRDTPEEELIQFHHGWGTGIRNSMGLWADNTELLKDTGKSHPDDASMVIIRAVWKELRSMSDAEIEASSVSNDDRVGPRELQEIAHAIEDFIQERVPQGIQCAVERDDDSVAVIVGAVDDPLNHVIEEFIRKRVPRGVMCFVKCNDRGVAVAVNLVDDPSSQYDVGMTRNYSDD